MDSYTPSCSGSTQQNFTVLAIDVASGRVLWISPPLINPCTRTIGEPDLVSVLADRVVLTVATDGGNVSGEGILFGAYDPSTGGLLQSQTYYYPSNATTTGAVPYVSAGFWPVVNGLLGTWHAHNSTTAVIQTYALETFDQVWNVSVHVGAASAATPNSADLVDLGDGIFTAGNRFCVTTDPEPNLQGYSEHYFQFRNATVGCVSAQTGALAWEQNVSGPAALIAGTASATTYYFLDNSSGTLTVRGFSLENGDPISSFPVLGQPSLTLGLARLAFVDGLLTVTNSGPYDLTAGPPAFWGTYQAYLPNGTLRWTQTFPEESFSFQGQSEYVVEPPLPLSGGRLLWCDYLQGTYVTATGIGFTQVFITVNATSGAVLSHSVRLIDKSIEGQYAGDYIGIWLPVAASGSTVLFYSYPDLIAASF
jgi:hypothetical protein